MTYDKHGLLEMVVDGLLENIYRRDTAYIRLLDKSGVFTQQSCHEDLKGAHWNRGVRGMTLVVIKLISEQID